jgi:vitamin B12 transporter
MTPPIFRPAILLGATSTFTILAAIITATLATNSVRAEEASENIEEITVTALRTPVSLAQMPTATSVIDRQLIDARQSFQVLDLLRDLPGISIARTGGVGGQAQLRMRGAEANHVLVIIDGVEVNDPASGDEFQWEHLTSADIERIEVIRGPQSALWGSDAVAGVISITTRHGGGGESEGFHVSANAEAGSFSTYRASGRASAVGDGWQLNANAGYSDSEGSNISRTGDEDDGYRNVLAGASLGLTPSPTLQLTFTARHSDRRTESDPVDFFVTGLPVDGDRVNNTRRTYLGAKADLQLMDGRLRQKVGINWVDTNNSNLADGLPDGVTAAERLQLSAQTTFEVTKGQRLTAAVDHETTDFAQRGNASFWGDPNQDQQLKTTGLVLDYVGEFGGLTTFASLRHDRNSDFANAESWRLGANYALSPGTRLRASIGTGQKAPTMLERFGFFSDLFLGNPDLKPERSTNFEVGLDQDLADGRVTVKLTYFNARLRDEIDGFVFDLDTFMFTAANKPGKSRRQGVELELQAALSAEFSLSANYTYLKAEEEAADGSFTTELRRPKHQGGATLLYAREGGFSAALNASYTGEARDIFFPPWPNPSEIVTMDGYWLLSLSGEHPISDNLSITARVENAFNSDYEDVFGFQNPGRAVYAGLRTSF